MNNGESQGPVKKTPSTASSQENTTMQVVDRFCLKYGGGGGAVNASKAQFHQERKFWILPINVLYFVVRFS